MVDGRRCWTRLGLLAASLALAAAAVACGSSDSGRSTEGGTGNPPPSSPPPSSPPPDQPAQPKYPRIEFGTLGPWPAENVVYGAADGIQEAVVVGVTTDEAQNRWVATNRALYVLRPGATRFIRFDQRDGLHFTPDARSAAELNPAWSELYCNERPVPDRVDDCRGYGSVMSYGGGIFPGISEITGGGPNEVFVGYHGTHPELSDDEFATDLGDPGRHTGKLDRVTLHDDDTITVDRFDLVTNGHGAKYWHNRTVLRLVYDHFAHPDTLYVGTNHGVTLLFPRRFRYPEPGEWFDHANRDWMGDHLHAQVCRGAPCIPGRGNQLMGDWRGLAVDANGDLWHAGKWSAGLITWVDDPWLWFERAGAAFAAAFGDPYPVAPNDEGFQNEPVFKVAVEGDPVELSAVTVCPDGRAWFASRTSFGIAVWRGRSFQTFSARETGLGEDSVADLACLPDGRLAVAGFSTGLVLWDPATGKRVRVEGLPSQSIVRLEVDRMIDPPALHVATRNGAAILRVLP